MRAKTEDSVGGHGTADVQAAITGRFRAPSPYLVVSTLAVLGAALISYRQPWVGDFGLHAAVVGRLRDDLLDPADPMVRADAPSPYFTPYTVVLALVARVTGVSAVVVLSAAAPANLALLLYGLRRFVGLFTDSRWAPLLALTAVPLLWGPLALSWSGFPTLRGLALILPYPSTVAFALMLLSWVLVGRALIDSRWWRWGLVGLLGGVLLLVHPFTAAGAALGGLALMLGRLPRSGGLSRSGLPFGLPLAAAVVGTVALSWPYFRIIEVLAAAGELDEIHWQLYADPLANYGYAVAAGLPALLLRLRSDWRDPLVFLFVLTGTVALAGGLTGAYSLGRVWPVLVLSLQVALAVELARLAGTWATRAARARVLVGSWAGATALACLAGLAGQYGNLLLLLPPEQLTPARRAAHQITYPPAYGWVAREVSQGELVLTGEVGAARALLAYEIRAVAPPWPDPLLPDERQRHADQAELLDPATPEPRRRELLIRYGVDWVLDLRGTYTWADQYAAWVVERPGSARLLRLG